MKEVSFVSGNQGKYEEIRPLFEQAGIRLVWVNQPKPESPDQWDISLVAAHAAEQLSQQLNKIVIVEDTGLFFDAYTDFPGPHSKFAFHALGYEGLLKLLEGKSRRAEFKTVAALCNPGQKSHLFEGVCKGSISEQPQGKTHPALPYDAVFIPEGETDTWALLPAAKKKISHRKQAFEKALAYLKNTGENHE